MKSKISKGINPLIKVFTVAILFRSVLLLISISSNGYDKLINEIILAPGNDPLTYHQLAINIINNHSFAYQYELPPVSLRTPGYPVFIAFFYFIFGYSPIVILIIQIIFDSFTSILIYLMAKNLFNNKTALIASYLYSIEPHASIYSISMYSDTIFVFFISLFGYHIIKYFLELRTKNLVFLSIFLGIATLIKPSSVYIPVIIMIFIIIYFRKNLKKILINGSLFVSLFILTLSPWLVRNYLHYNKFFLSTSGEYNLLVLNITPLKMNLSHQNQDETIYQLLAEADSLMKTDGEMPIFKEKPKNYWEELTLQYDFNKAKYWRKLAFIYIEKYPFEFIKFYSLGIMHTFINLATSAYSIYFNFTPVRQNFNIKSESNFIQLIKNYLSAKNIYELLAGFLILIYLIIVYSGLLYGLIKSELNENRLVKILVFSVIIYFIIISGAGGLARFKLPSIPFYLVFSAAGVNYFLIKFFIK